MTPDFEPEIAKYPKSSYFGSVRAYCFAPFQAWAPDRPDVKIKDHGLGQFGAEPHYSTLPYWQLCAVKG